MTPPPKLPFFKKFIRFCKVEDCKDMAKCENCILHNTIQSLLINREVSILTLTILIALQGCIYWYIIRDGLMMREWPYTASNQDVLYPYTAEMRVVLDNQETKKS